MTAQDQKFEEVHKILNDKVLIEIQKNEEEIVNLEDSFKEYRIELKKR